MNTNQKSTCKIAYGTSPTYLSQLETDNSFDLEHEVILSGLSPDTQYYFRATAVNSSGKTSISDIFSVKTAITSEAATVLTSTFVVTSSNKVLVAPINPPSMGTLTEQEQKTLVIPQITVYDFRFSLIKKEPIKSIKAVLRKKKTAVLGASTSILAQLFSLNKTTNTEAEDFLGIAPPANFSNVNVEEVSLTEIQPGIYYGKLISDLPKGEYELFAVIADDGGNISETKLSNVKVINRFTVLSKETKEPIEAARIYLSFYNPTLKKYNPLLPTLISITNPSFTDPKGESSVVLPQGKYRALVSNLGYKDKTLDFTIGIGKNDGFPTVYLDKEGFNPISAIIYYGRSIRDVYIYYTMQYFVVLSKSLRFFNLINAISLALLIIVTFLSFRFRTHIPLRSIFSYFAYHLRKLSGKDMSTHYLEGFVMDEKTKRPIGKAQVFLVNAKTHQTVKQTSTNANGHFFFKLSVHENYEILAVKKGYEVMERIEAAKELYSKTSINILLKESESTAGIFNTILTKLIEAPIGYLFEYLLISSLLFEIASVPYFGFQRTFPFILISGFNLLLWVLHLKQKSQSGKVI